MQAGLHGSVACARLACFGTLYSIYIADVTDGNVPATFLLILCTSGSLV